MSFIHFQLSAGPSNFVEVTIDKQANVLLLDNANFQLYRQGRRCRYLGGGHYKRSPVHLRPPRQDNWHVVVNSGGPVRSTLRVI